MAGGMGTGDIEDPEIQRAMLDSIKQQNSHGVFQSTFTAEERKRVNGFPVGLQNVGNTCYFNSLMQTYFYMPEFVKQVLDFQIPKEINIKERNQMQFIKCIQVMFAKMIKGN
jgi:ubiquitin carboxyl-terminal hydrolase 25